MVSRCFYLQVNSHLKRSYVRCQAHRQRNSRASLARGGQLAHGAPAVAYTVDTQSETVCLQARNNSVQPPHQRKNSVPLALLGNGIGNASQRAAPEAFLAGEIIVVENNIPSNSDIIKEICCQGNDTSVSHLSRTEAANKDIACEDISN